MKIILDTYEVKHALNGNGGVVHRNGHIEVTQPEALYLSRYLKFGDMLLSKSDLRRILKVMN